MDALALLRAELLALDQVVVLDSTTQALPRGHTLASP
jgi:hypothetical protein